MLRSGRAYLGHDGGEDAGEQDHGDGEAGGVGGVLAGDALRLPAEDRLDCEEDARDGGVEARRYACSIGSRLSFCIHGSHNTSCLRRVDTQRGAWLHGNFGTVETVITAAFHARYDECINDCNCRL